MLKPIIFITLSLFVASCGKYEDTVKATKLPVVDIEWENDSRDISFRLTTDSLSVMYDTDACHFDVVMESNSSLKNGEFTIQSLVSGDPLICTQTFNTNQKYHYHALRYRENKAKVLYIDNQEFLRNYHYL